MRAFAAAAALGVFAALLAAPAVPQDGPVDEAAIRAKIRAATEPLPAEYRETLVSRSSNGTTSVEHAFVRGDDDRYVDDAGPLHTEEGSLRGTTWRMNANGQVVRDDLPAPEEFPVVDLKPAVSRVREPVDGWLIASLDAKGFGTKRYVDGTAWQIVRVEEISSEGTVVRTYGDFRPDHGRTFAHRIRTEDGPAKRSDELTVESYEPGGVTDADLAIPPPRRRLVEFPAATPSAELPVRFVGDAIFVRVTIAGRGLDFTLDTGASGITIDTSVARELGLAQFDRRSAVLARRYSEASAIVPEMRVGSLVMRNVAVRVVPHGWETAPGVKDVGLLGYDFLAELGLTLDYEHKRVTAVPGASFQAPGDPDGTAFEIHLGTGVPRTTVALNGVPTKEFIVDSGAEAPVILTDRFARYHPEAFTYWRPAGKPHYFRGIGGVFHATPYRVGLLQLGGWDLRLWIAYRIESGSYASTGIDGLIGSDFLKLFTVSLDYEHQRIHLVPNHDGREMMGLK
ncbi:MAG TPA: retropepsin-like aspartic protease [Candidatus Elarobacter sp.]|jgi:predicted aspartyl protease|nr:retropepsin-like aspartic protease [Candidatus Elarobacter sp.]